MKTKTYPVIILHEGPGLLFSAPKKEGQNPNMKNIIIKGMNTESERAAAIRRHAFTEQFLKKREEETGGETR